MAASTTPRPSRSRSASRPDDPGGALAPLHARLPLAVAYSGGADSTALLLACARRFPGDVLALHVHHGLQAAADDFEAHCRAQCARLGVPLVVRRVDARHEPGQSPEDAARRARYAALADAARLGLPDGRACRTVLLAQHADDQLETVLLALSRGSGLPGLAGMRAAWEREGVRFERPWLGLRGADIRNWLAKQGLGHVEDPTNADLRRTRNRIRARCVPALTEALPGLPAAAARSARHAAQAQALLDELAQADLAEARSEAGPDRPGLRLAWLQAHSRARQANLIRHWLSSVHGACASTAQMDELLDQVAACVTRGHAIRMRVGTGLLQREGDELAWYTRSQPRAAAG